MNTLARRTLRTTAAAAGIAAVGAGFAAPAFAAPEVPAAPSTDQLGARPDTAALGSLPASPGVPALPGPFRFEMPSVTSAGPGAVAVPATPELGAPALPQASATPTVPGVSAIKGSNHVSGPSTDPAYYARQNDVGALSALDTAKAMTGLAQKAVPAGSLTQGESLG